LGSERDRLAKQSATRGSHPLATEVEAQKRAVEVRMKDIETKVERGDLKEEQYLQSMRAIYSALRKMAAQGGDNMILAPTWLEVIEGEMIDSGAQISSHPNEPAPRMLPSPPSEVVVAPPADSDEDEFEALANINHALDSNADARRIEEDSSDRGLYESKTCPIGGELGTAKPSGSARDTDVRGPYRATEAIETRDPADEQDYANPPGEGGEEAPREGDAEGPVDSITILVQYVCEAQPESMLVALTAEVHSTICGSIRAVPEGVTIEVHMGCAAVPFGATFQECGVHDDAMISVTMVLLEPPMPHAGVACITILEKEQERLVRLYDQMKSWEQAAAMANAQAQSRIVEDRMASLKEKFDNEGLTNQLYTAGVISMRTSTTRFIAMSTQPDVSNQRLRLALSWLAIIDSELMELNRDPEEEELKNQLVPPPPQLPTSANPSQLESSADIIDASEFDDMWDELANE